MKKRCDAVTDYLFELLRFTIAYVDPEIAGKRVGEHNTRLLSWQWPGDDESILPTVTSIVDTTMGSIVNPAIVCLPDPSQKFRKFWGSREKSNGDRGAHPHNITPIFDNYTADGWVKVAMKWCNPTWFCIMFVANKPTAHLVPRHLCVVAAAIFLWMISSHLQLRIWSTISAENWMMMLRCGTRIEKDSRRQQQACDSSEIIFNGGLSDSSDTLKSCETMVLVSLPITSNGFLLMRLWLGSPSTITLCILPLRALLPIGSVQAAAQLQISHFENAMHCLDGRSKICVVGGYFAGNLEGGQMGDNLEFVGEVLGLILVFCSFWYYIGHGHAWRAVLRIHDVVTNH